MDWTTVFLVIAVLIGLGMVLYFALAFYAFKEFKKKHDQIQKEFDDMWGDIHNDRRIP